MEIKEIKDKNIWEDFLLQCGEKTFLSSWNWGEFQEKMGNSAKGGSASGGKIWRLGIYENKQLVTIALVTKIQAKRGTFFLIQHGPVLISNSPGRPQADSPEGCFLISNQTPDPKFQILNTLLDELKKIGKEENCDFIRIAPLLPRNEENLKIFKDLGLREAPMHANAYEATWKLDLVPSEDELLMNMRKTTRYLIRQVLKNPDISIEKSNNLEDFGIYQKLNEEVSERQKFVPFSEKYIKNEFEVFSKDNEILWLFGKYKREVAAGALIIFWSGIGFYHQAASLAQYAKFSIPYLIQWEAIKEAKKRGCRLYDFWGFVDPQKHPKHPWVGPTLFKMGFGGRAYEYVKTQDYPLSKKYWLTYLFEKFRKTKRGL